MEYSVDIPNATWMKHGGKMMKWIHDHISEECYRLRFGSYVGNNPITIVFDNSEQATFFKLGTHGWLIP